MSAPTPNPSRSAARAPEEWWRTLCEVVLPNRRGARIVLSGDLHQDPVEASRQLCEWQAYGISHILDVRDEWSDRAFVAERAPEITYIDCGTHDDGAFGVRQDATWFDRAITALGPTLGDPDAVVLVHCHMGVNRAPSMALRLLLEQGASLQPALDAIRAARPIAAIAYAEDAVDHWLVGCGDDEAVAFGEALVLMWHDANPVDASWIVSRIREVEE